MCIRDRYWLGVGAQPTDQVLNLLKITGDWQKFKGLKGAEGTLKTAAAKPEAAVLVEEAENKAQKLKAAKAEAAAKAAEAETPAEVQHDDEKVELADVEESAPESV